MNHRKDSRSLDQFKEDIKVCHRVERGLMELYVGWLNSQPKNKGNPYSFVDNGIDNSGDYIENEKDVDCRADFLLERPGSPARAIEVKFCRPFYNRFHIKKHQAEYYVVNDVAIVNFMGIETQKRCFCILRPLYLRDLLSKGEFAPFWGKQCLRIYNKEVEWQGY